jgi:hypothetical protein
MELFYVTQLLILLFQLHFWTSRFYVWKVSKGAELLPPTVERNHSHYHK